MRDIEWFQSTKMVRVIGKMSNLILLNFKQATTTKYLSIEFPPFIILKIFRFQLIPFFATIKPSKL